MDEPPVTWNPRRKNWMGDRPSPPPSATPVQPVAAGPLISRPVAPVVVPWFPAFSQVAIAALLRSSRSTVHYWIVNGKLEAFEDNVGERYVLRAELVRFVREYLQRECREGPPPH